MLKELIIIKRIHVLCQQICFFINALSANLKTVNKFFNIFNKNYFLLNKARLTALIFL
jgi:hypothetical protein